MEREEYFFCLSFLFVLIFLLVLFVVVVFCFFLYVSGNLFRFL